MTLLHHTPSQHLQHFFTTLLYNTSPQHSFTTLLDTASPQHFSTTLAYKTSRQHVSTTLLHNTSPKATLPATLLYSPSLQKCNGKIFYQNNSPHKISTEIL